MTHKKYVPALIAGVVFFLLILLAVRLGSRENAAPEDAAAISQGVSYLQSLEAQDPDTVDNVLKQQRLQHLQEMRDERMRQLESGEVSVWSLFEDYVLLGDSRAVGFSFYGFLPEERVLAESGATILHLEEHIPDIVALNPSNIFLCYGLNDIIPGHLAHSRQTMSPSLPDIIHQIHDPAAGRQYLHQLDSSRPGLPRASVPRSWYNIPQYSQALRRDVRHACSHCYLCGQQRNLADEYARPLGV